MAHGLDSVNSFAFKSIICGFHAYKNAVAIIRDDQIVGHIPQVNSKLCAFYIRRGGTIKCRVIGKRQHGLGLAIPCIYIFKGNEKDTNALISLLKS